MTKTKKVNNNYKKLYQQIYVDNIDQMAVSCPLQNKHIKTAIKQLKEMKDALGKIDKTVELIVSIN